MTGRPAGRLAAMAGAAAPSVLPVLAVSAALAVSAVLVAGCTGMAGPSPGTAGPSPRAAGTQPGRPLVVGTGGAVTVASDSVPTTLNDHTAAGATAITRALASMVWAQVFQLAPGEAPTLDTDVVQSAEVVSVAPQTVVYQIDPRAVWSDGTPVSAQDFVYAWLAGSGNGRDVDGSPDSVVSSAGYSDIASVAGSNGGRTVTVVFQAPYADWTSLFDDLLPSHVAERVGWNHGFDHFDPAVLLSAGPFVVTSWTPGRQITFGRNPRWWGTPARLDRIVVQAVPGASAMAAALRSGAAQVAYPDGFDARFEAEVSSSPQLQTASNLGTTSLQLLFNTRHAPLDVTGVRQGIAHFVDRASLVKTLVQPLAPLVWEDNDHLFANSEPWYADDAAGYQQPDPVAGARLLAAGGLVPNEQGSWTAHGAPVTLHFVWASDDPWSAAAAPALAAQLVAAGFDVSSVPTSTADLLGSVLPNGAFDLALAPVDTGAWPSTLSSAFGSVSTGPQGTSGGSAADWTGFDDPRIDALFVQAAQELAADQDQQLYQQIDTALWTAMPSLPLFAEPTMIAWAVTLRSVQDDPGGLGPFWHIGRWAKLVPATGANSSGHSRDAGTAR